MMTYNLYLHKHELLHLPFENDAEEEKVFTYIKEIQSSNEITSTQRYKSSR